MRRIDPPDAQEAADRDRGSMITVAQCCRLYNLTEAELAELGPPRLGAPKLGREPAKVHRLEAVLALVERLRPATTAVHEAEWPKLEGAASAAEVQP